MEAAGGGDRRQGFMGNQELGKEFWILFQDSCFLKKKKKRFQVSLLATTTTTSCSDFHVKNPSPADAGPVGGRPSEEEGSQEPPQRSSCRVRGGLHRGVGHGSER